MGNHGYEDILTRQNRNIVSLMREIDYRNQKLMEMEHKYNETTATMKKLIVELTKNIDSGEKKQSELEDKYSECSAMVRSLMYENKKLHEEHHRELELMKVMNTKMNHDMECLKRENGEFTKELAESKALNDQQQKNFIEEIEKLKRELKLQDQNSLESDSNLNTQMNTFREQLKGKMDYSESLESTYHILTVLELQYKQELQKARKESINEIVDENDEKLKVLREEYGEAVYKAVANALMELEQYNSSGRYAVSEIWNWKEGRRASLKEIIQYIVRQLKTHKRKRNWN